MVSSCGRFVISYNGEVYNADELRPELEAAGTSVPRPQRYRGHRRRRRRVGRRGDGQAPDRHVRDGAVGPAGAGALPCPRSAWHQAALLGRFRRPPAVRLRAEGAARERRAGRPSSIGDALAAFLRFGYVPAPHAIYRGVQKLPPGTILTVRSQGPPAIAAYWSLDEVARHGQAARFAGRRGRGRRCARRVAARRGRAADGRGRAARRLSFRRDRFIDRRRADAGAKRAARAHLLDRLRRAQAMTRRERRGGGAAIWERSIPSSMSRRSMRSR